MGVGPHVLVLGPSKDHHGKSWPLALRRDVALMLQQRKCPAIVMEDVETLPGESPARKFERIVEEYNVCTFVVAWPKACRLNGLDVEFGFLLSKVMDGKLDARDVKLLTHSENVRMAADGTWELGEKGNRTRYYESLLDEGCTVLLFGTAGHLELNVSAAAIDHHQRHVFRVDERSFVGEAARKLKRASSRRADKPPLEGSGPSTPQP